MSLAMEPLIDLVADGINHSPQELGGRLASLTAGGDIAADYYGDGGPVTALEQQIAALLGKERAVMMPTGTLANMLALREMAAGRGPRVVVHRDSHIYNDAGDNLTTGAGITMVPLASDGASFDPAQLEAEIARTASARVAASLGGVVIELPSRRLANRMFEPGRRAAVIGLAKAAGIPLLLDGARILIEAEWTGRTPAEIAAPFDYVYVSLYKYLKAPFGAILAGPAGPLEKMFHERRRFGGGIYQMWPAALLALDALPTQPGLWRQAHQASEVVFAALEGQGITVNRYADGSNASWIAAGAAATEAAALPAQTAASGLKLAPAVAGRLGLRVNESWLRLPPEALAARIAALVSG